MLCFAEKILNFFRRLRLADGKGFCSRASTRLIIIYFTMSAERLYQCRNWVLLCSRATLRQIWIGFTMSAECLYQCKIMVYATALAWDHDRIAFAKSTERLYQCQKRILLCSRACENTWKHWYNPWRRRRKFWGFVVLKVTFLFYFRLWDDGKTLEKH